MASSDDLKTYVDLYKKLPGFASYGVGTPEDSFLTDLYRQLYTADGGIEKLIRQTPKDQRTAQTLNDLALRQQAFFEHPFTRKVDMPDGKTASGLHNTLSLLSGNIKKHPGTAALTAGLGITNLAGLFDNDKLAGQLIGGIGGGLLGVGLDRSPLGKINFIQGGAALGSLFDKLRQKKADQRKAELAAQQQGYPQY